MKSTATSASPKLPDDAEIKEPRKQPKRPPVSDPPAQPKKPAPIKEPPRKR